MAFPPQEDGGVLSDEFEQLQRAEGLALEESDVRLGAEGVVADSAGTDESELSCASPVQEQQASGMTRARATRVRSPLPRPPPEVLQSLVDEWHRARHEGRFEQAQETRKALWERGITADVGACRWSAD